MTVRRPRAAARLWDREWTPIENPRRIGRADHGNAHRSHLVAAAWKVTDDRDRRLNVVTWACSAAGTKSAVFQETDVPPTCIACGALDEAQRMGHTPGVRSVYFAERGGLIKIGSSANVGVRMATLKTRLLAVDPAPFPPHTVIPESAAHWRFRHHHVQGEWFRPGPDLLLHIHNLAAS